jgi:Tfp pilus assembly protein PilP
VKRFRLTALAPSALLVLATLSPFAAAQSPATASPTTSGGSARPGPPADYSYQSEGRRDPFVSLVARGTETAPSVRRGEGVQGLSVAELSVRGVMQSRGGYVAIVQGPDQKTHIVRPKDRLADGTVKAITPQGLLIVQEVNEPLSLDKQREIRKPLYGSEEGK